MGMSNAASILCETAGLTDFRPTPVSIKRLSDHHLAARARLRLALDQRTAAADLQVQADNGILTVTYPPQQEEFASEIPEVLGVLDGCRTIQCTMAETSILWVQERFQPDSSGFQQITSLAQRWGAAIELMRLIPPGSVAPESGLDTDREAANPRNSQPMGFYSGSQLVQDLRERPLAVHVLPPGQEQGMAQGDAIRVSTAGSAARRKSWSGSAALAVNARPAAATTRSSRPPKPTASTRWWSSATSFSARTTRRGPG